MDETLTDMQREVLDYLARAGHSSRNTMRRIWHAVPGPTLAVLERKGYVTATPSTMPFSTNVRYEITDEGRRALGAATA
jgi:DNA-binding PadR family transcriptional regulator